MTLYTIQRLKSSLFMAIITLAGCSGFVFDYLTLGYITFWGPTVSFLMGLIIGLVEEFVYTKIKTRFHFAVEFMIKAAFHSLYTFSLFFLLILIYQKYYDLYIENYFDLLLSHNFIIPFLIANISIDYILLFLYLNKLLGRGRFFKYFMGSYRKAKEEERIFMFIDLNSSTQIAEEFGNKKFFRFLNDFFHDLTEPILHTTAHIYQYIGDEIVLTWTMQEGLKSSNCITIFFRIRKRIRKRKKYYLKKYGRVPKFKAGAHCGSITASELGDLKKEIVFNGDVMNTAARIRSKCSEMNCSFLISKNLHDKLNFPRKIVSESKGTFFLKGKAHPIELFAIKDCEH